MTDNLPSPTPSAQAACVMAKIGSAPEIIVKDSEAEHLKKSRVQASLDAESRGEIVFEKKS